jgi:hypothetical protein
VPGPECSAEGGKRRDSNCEQPLGATSDLLELILLTVALAAPLVDKQLELILVRLSIDPGLRRSELSGWRLIYTVSTQSEAPDIGNADHRGLLRTYADDGLTIATDAGDREIGWYEITAISAAPDYS